MSIGKIRGLNICGVARNIAVTLPSFVEVSCEGSIHPIYTFYYIFYYTCQNRTTCLVPKKFCNF